MTPEEQEIENARLAEVEAEKIRAEAEKLRIEAEIRAKVEAEFPAMKERMKTIGAVFGVYDIDENGNVHYAWFKNAERKATGLFLARVETNVTHACEVIFHDTIMPDHSDVEYFKQNKQFNGLLAMLRMLPPVKKNISIHLL